MNERPHYGHGVLLVLKTTALSVTTYQKCNEIVTNGLPDVHSAVAICPFGYHSAITRSPLDTITTNDLLAFQLMMPDYD
jgi:hypothetical protein